MEEFPQLSNREREVVQCLLEGKSNKQIASALSISDRTVEFHLKNIYVKFEVRSRVELVLKLGNPRDGLETEKLGFSTVAGKSEADEDGDGMDPWKWAAPLREAVYRVSEELKMKLGASASARNEGNPKTFFESIVISFAKYAEFNGRASRPEFWWFALFVILVASALVYLSEAIASVFLILMLLPLLAAGTRRLRDSGQSGWWQLLLLAPVGGIIVLGFLWAMPPRNELPDATPPA
ncbi:MAG TPA: LuxR C-terminal-related transcriptional regulator [Thermoflexales bacterium]|nr:LuxR C-terminal-related transcriptional regulator [Thermoflexales bacterium]